MKTKYILLIAAAFIFFNLSVEANASESKFVDRFSENNSGSLRSSGTGETIDLGEEPEVEDALKKAPVGDALVFIVAAGLGYSLFLYRRKASLKKVR
jgi:hypothetical protein